MKRAAASLAVAALCIWLPAGCGGDDAEPDAPRGAAGIANPVDDGGDRDVTLVLDFTPNAVHTGIYSAERRGYFGDAGLEVDVREPSGSADSAKLLETGRADFAIVDINDLGIARERGLEPVAIAAIVQRPLAAVIAADRTIVERPADLAGGTVGVTGVPSDEAVLRTILRADGVSADEVETVTIGFNAVSALAAMRVEAATAFWNAEGVELKRLRAPVIEFRVDELGAPRYPELVLATSPETLESGQDTACALMLALERGYRMIEINPKGAFEDLLRLNEGLERGSQASQLDALLSAEAFSRGAFQSGNSPRLATAAVGGWIDWAQENGLIGPGPEDAERAFAGFDLEFAGRCDDARGGG